MNSRALILLAVLATLAVPVLAEDAAPAPAPAISGRVVDRDSKPVPNAKIDLGLSWEDKSKPHGWDSKRETVTSDKDGRFTSSILSAASRSSLSVTVTAEGYCCASQYFGPDRGADLTLTLSPGYTAKGRVLDEKGKPLTGAKVTMGHCYGYGAGTTANVNLPEAQKTVTTGKDGGFKFSGLPRPDDYQYMNADLSVEAPGRARVRRYADKAVLSRLVEITDPLECKVEGTLYLPGKTGPAPAETQILFEVPYDRGSEGRYAKVEADGKFRLDKLPPGKVNIALETGRGSYGKKIDPMPWAMPAVLGAELKPRQTKHLELVMVPGVLVSGTVTDKATGKGIASVQLSIMHPGRPSFSDSVTTGDNGEFSVRVVPGDVTIVAERIDTRERQVYFDYDERPATTVQVAEGQDKSGVTLPIDLNADSQSIYQVQNTPIPPDFELKPGTYDLTWNADLDCSNAVYPRSKYEAGKVDQFLKKLPKLASTRVKRTAYQFDGAGDEGLLFLVLDESKGKGWDTAYLDFNRNGDLTDDEPLRIASSAKSGRSRTDWVTVQTRTSDGTMHPCGVRLTIFGTDGPDPYVQINRKGGWTGTIETSKGKVDCATVDMNSNGVFGDLMGISESLQSSSQGDAVFVNTNGFSQLVAASWAPHHVGIHEITKVGGKFYQITVSPLGDRITVEPYTGALGQLLVRGENIQGLDATMQSAQVVSSSGCYSFAGRDGKPVTVPVGTYRVSSCAMLFDTPGKPNLGCSLNRTVTVEADKQSDVTVTGRLSLAIDPDKDVLAYDAGSSGAVNWSVRIGDVATVTSLADADRSNAPFVKFLKNGKQVGESLAEYG